MMKAQTPQFLRKRKFLLLLPAIVLPFITLIAWSMGVGSTSKQIEAKQAGLNKELPDAKIKTEAYDKMSLYAKALKDSIAKQQQQTLDPFKQPDTALSLNDSFISSGDPSYGSATPPVTGGLRTNADPNELKVRERLASLERALHEPPANPAPYGPYGTNPSNTSLGADLDRLEQMMHTMAGNEKGDPEVTQLNDVMEKVLDLQYPDRAVQKLKALSKQNKGRVYAVSKASEQTEAALIKRPEQSLATQGATQNNAAVVNAFYNINGTTAADTQQEAIPAVIHETQTLVNGSTVKLRLSEDIFINGTLIPAGNFVFGTASVNGERLGIEIGGIRYGKSLFPVNLNVYDLDALEGIHIPGAITRDAVKDGSDRAIQSVQLTSLDPSIAGQAAGVGVEAAKGLFSKKVKLIRVTVKAGYPVLLMDEKARQEQSN